MSTLFNAQNAPRDEAALGSLSQAILYRIAMQLNLFISQDSGLTGDNPEQRERGFMSLTSTQKAPVILRALLNYDQNPQAAAAQMMTHPGAAPAGAQQPMTQSNFPGGPPPGAGYPPQQQGLPYGQPAYGGPPGGPPSSPPPGGPPPGAWQPHGPPQGAQAPQQQQPYYAPAPASQGGPPPGWQPPGGAPQGGYTPPPSPPHGPPPGYTAGPPQGYTPPQGPPQGAPPGPPQGGWQPPGGAPQGGWQPPGAPPGGPQGGPPPGPPGAPPGAPPGYPPQGAPARSPQTASDPNNQGSVGNQLLQAIQNLTQELQNQNRLLAGLSTLTESTFILNIIMAQRMGITNEELTHRLASERDGIKAQFLTTGK